MDREKAEVYGLLTDIFLKAIITLVCLGVYVVIVGFLLWKPSWYLSVPSAVLPGAFYIIIKHFFPARGATSAAGAKSRVSKKKPPEVS
jgi:hypothetical protein